LAEHSIQNSENCRNLARFLMERGTGGKSGIRTLAAPLDSVSCRFHNARVAVDARIAVAPCPLLPAGPRSQTRHIVADRNLHPRVPRLEDHLVSRVREIRTHGLNGGRTHNTALARSDR
jgi:hypothetical protein